MYVYAKCVFCINLERASLSTGILQFYMYGMNPKLSFGLFTDTFTFLLLIKIFVYQIEWFSNVFISQSILLQTFCKELRAS